MVSMKDQVRFQIKKLGFFCSVLFCLLLVFTVNPRFLSLGCGSESQDY